MKEKGDRPVALRKSIKYRLMAIGVIPIGLVSILLFFGFMTSLRNMAYDLVEYSALHKLKADVNAAHLFLEKHYGSLYLEDGELMDAKGQKVAGRHAMVDDIKRNLGVVATIFQRDEEAYDFRRITTNVPTESGQRAVGTFLGNDSPAFRPSMLGELYIGEAKILGIPYYTAYDPIIREGEVIGILFIGITTEDAQGIVREYVAETRRKVLFSGLLLSALFGGVFIFLLAHRVFSPIMEMSSLFAKAAEGDLGIRSDYVSEDEIGRVCESFNQMMTRLNELTYFDGVTSLPNLKVFMMEFGQHAEGNRGALGQLVVALVGLDRFSRINDLYGYEKGNQVLRALGQRLREHLPSRAHLFRGQGDEFILLWKTQMEQEDLKDALKRVLEQLTEPFSLAGKSLSLGVSLGFSVFPRHGETAEEIVESAGLARNVAKMSHDRVQIFEDRVRDAVTEMHALEYDLKDAIAEDQLFIEYQPLLHLDTGKPYGLEALLRWNHPERGRIPPDVFIPIAERVGLIVEIGQWVVEKACMQFKAWQDKGLCDLILSVNVSPKQLAAYNLFGVIRGALQKSGLEPQFLEIELTEGALIQDLDRSVYQMNQLREQGIGISVDDFGTGYSSLSYLVRLPVDTLKIDRSFVQSIGLSHQSQTIVATIVAMGRSLGLQIVAEGIESEEQVQFLTQHGCGIGQGFLFSRPLSVKDAEAFLRKTMKK